MGGNFLFFTGLVGMPVLDLKHRRIGRVRDAAIVPLMHSSRIDRVLVGGGDSWLTIRYDQIQSIALGKGIALSDEQLTPYHEDEYMLRIGRDLLDQQIIDVTGRKVVRVNDLTFEIQKDGERDTLVVLEVDIGVRAIIGGCSRACCRPGGSAACRRPSRPIPSNGTSATCWSPTRCAAFGSTFPTRNWSACTRPTWPTSSRN